MTSTNHPHLVFVHNVGYAALLHPPHSDSPPEQPSLSPIKKPSFVFDFNMFQENSEAPNLPLQSQSPGDANQPQLNSGEAKEEEEQINERSLHAEERKQRDAEQKTT